MQRSTDRIYTTHVGSPARPPALLDLMQAAATRRSCGPSSRRWPRAPAGPPHGSGA